MDSIFHSNLGSKERFCLFAGNLTTLGPPNISSNCSEDYAFVVNIHQAFQVLGIKVLTCTSLKPVKDSCTFWYLKLVWIMAVL